MPQDNDLLTLWLRAEKMTKQEIRDVIEELQNARDERSDEHEAELDERAETIEALERENAELQDRVDELEREGMDGAGL